MTKSVSADEWQRPPGDSVRIDVIDEVGKNTNFANTRWTVYNIYRPLPLIVVCLCVYRKTREDEAQYSGGGERRHSEQPNANSIPTYLLPILSFTMTFVLCFALFAAMI